MESGKRGQNLVLTGDWNKRAARKLRSGNVDGLILNYARGFRERDLSFLKGLPVRRVQVLARTLDDITPLYELANTLEVLYLEAGSRAKIDLGRFPQLRVLASDWPHISDSIAAATRLEELHVGGLTGEDLTLFPALTNLTRLRLIDRPRLRSLHGLNQFPNLAALDVVSAWGLQDFSALRTEVNPATLCRLSLEGCSQLARLDEFAGLVNLIYLNIAGCGEIESIRPLERLTKLETVVIFDSTDVLDGDLSPLLWLPALRWAAVMGRRKYKPSAKGIAAAIASTPVANGSTDRWFGVGGF